MVIKTQWTQMESCTCALTAIVRTCTAQVRQSPSFHTRGGHTILTLAEELLGTKSFWKNQFSLKVLLWQVDHHTTVDGHTPKNIWKAQIRLDLKKKKRAQSWVKREEGVDLGGAGIRVNYYQNVLYRVLPVLKIKRQPSWKHFHVYCHWQSLTLGMFFEVTWC